MSELATSSLYVECATGVIACTGGEHAVGVYRSVLDGEWRALCTVCDERATEGTMLHRLPTLDGPPA